MHRILIVGPSWVGDMVMAQSLFRVLRQQRPDCQITVLAPAWSGPVLARMPEVDANEVMPVGHGKLELGMRWRLGRKLRNHYDQAIVLPGSLKSALVPWFAGIKARTGFVGEQRYGLLNDIRKLDSQALPYSVQRSVSLGLDAGLSPPALEDIPWPALKADSQLVAAVAESHRIKASAPLLAMCPGAEFGPAKQWPAAHFAATAAHYLELGWQVMVLGSKKDQSVASEISTAAPGCIDLTGRTSLGEAIDLMSMAACVLSNDSGLMHIGAAVGAHVVALYGSSTDQFTPPLTTKADRLYLDLPCRPCFQRHCPLGHLDCLNKLMPKTVIEAIARQHTHPDHRQTEA